MEKRMSNSAVQRTGVRDVRPASDREQLDS